MIVKSFRSVGWVAAVAASALSCYMLSLQVAAERSQVSELEDRIIAARQDIRSLQTELGTRGRLQQLERWNTEVLALSAPVSGQHVENEVTLARFDMRQPTFEERTRVQLASVEAAPPQPQRAAPQAAPAPAPRLAPQLASVRQDADQPAEPIVRRASLVEAAPAPTPRPVRAAAAPRRESLIDRRVVEEIGRTERAERSQEAAD